MIVRDQDPGFQGRPPGALLHALSQRLALLVLVLFMTLPTVPASAAGRDALILTGPADVQAISQHLEYTIDADWQLRVQDFVGPSAVEMQPVLGPTPDFGYTAARIWLRVQVVNQSATISDWRFLMHVGFLQQLAIYRVGADNAVTTLVDLQEDSPFRARPIDYPQVVAPLDLAPGEAATVIVMYQSLGAARHAMSIETPDSFVEKARVAAAKNYAFYGMILVMIALAAVALVSFRELVFAAYIAYLLSVFVYIAHGDGTAFQYLWPTLPQINSMAAAVAGSGVMVFGGLFAITFLRTARYHPVMHRLLLVVMASVLVLDIVLWATDPKLLNRLLVYMILVSVLTFVAAGLVAARTRFREVRFYLFSWTAGLIPAFLFTGRFAFGLEPSFITTYDAMRLALVIDVLMMGLAIFDSYNHQRQSAMEETLAHAQRNLALSQRLTLLEDRYEQVTTSARQREESVKDTVHDLRQPMHALRLSLRQMFDAQARKTTDAGQIESALAYMEQLVAERLAETSAMSAPANAASPVGGEPGLHAVLRGVADMFAAEAEEKGLGLKLVLAAPDAPVASYPLMRVVANLVSNAIKYTREGRILITLRRSGAGHRIDVHDTGPGLQGATFELALLRNQRLDRDLDAAPGSGLGLSVARETAQANGWAITSCANRRTGASIGIDLPGESVAIAPDVPVALPQQR